MLTDDFKLKIKKFVFLKDENAKIVFYKDHVLVKTKDYTLRSFSTDDLSYLTDVIKVKYTRISIKKWYISIQFYPLL